MNGDQLFQLHENNNVIKFLNDAMCANNTSNRHACLRSVDYGKKHHKGYATCRINIFIVNYNFLLNKLAITYYK